MAVSLSFGLFCLFLHYFGVCLAGAWSHYQPVSFLALRQCLDHILFRDKCQNSLLWTYLLTRPEGSYKVYWKEIRRGNLKSNEIIPSKAEYKQRTQLRIHLGDCKYCSKTRINTAGYLETVERTHGQNFDESPTIHNSRVTGNIKNCQQSRSIPSKFSYLNRTAHCFRNQNGNLKTDSQLWNSIIQRNFKYSRKKWWALQAEHNWAG